MDERVLRIVLSQPIPDKLIRDLALVELVRFPRRYSHGRGRRRQMTPALYETLKLVCRGLSNRQIADAMGGTPEAAKDRVKRLLAYFDETNRTSLVTRCYRERIV